MQTVEINGQEVEMPEDREVAITKQVFDVFDIEARVNTVSTIFNVPESMVNSAVIDDSTRFDNNSSFPYTSQAVSIFKDGVPLMNNGTLLVNGYNGDGLECLAVDDNGDVFTLINQITWDDVIDYIAANIQSSAGGMEQTLGIDEFTGLWIASQGGNDQSTDYIVAPIAKPKAETLVSGNTVWLYQYGIPHVFVTRLMELILATVGSTYSTVGVTADNWTDGAIPVDTMKLTPRAVENTAWNRDYNLYQSGVSSAGNIVSIQFAGWQLNSSFNVSFDSEYTGGLITISTNNVQIQGLSSLKFNAIESPNAKIRVIIDIVGDMPTASALSIIRRETTDWSEVYYEELFGGGVTNYKIEAEVERGSYPQFLLAFVFHNATAPAPGVITGSVEYQFIEGSEVQGGMPFDLIGNLPFDTPSDAFRFLLSHYGWFPIYDKYSKNITLHKQQEVLDNITNAYDWSDKLDLITSEEVTYYLEGLGQSTKFLFENSDELGGEGSILISATNLPESVDFFESDAARSREVVYCTVDTVEYDLVKAVLDASAPLGYTIDRTGSNGLRIVKIEPSGASIKVWTGSGTTTITGYKKATQGGLNDFQTLIDEKYQLIKKSYAQPKVLTANFTLDVSEIENFDFTKPVYIDKFGRYFYVNSIDNFISGLPTSCTLIAI